MTWGSLGPRKTESDPLVTRSKEFPESPLPRAKPVVVCSLPSSAQSTLGGPSRTLRDEAQQEHSAGPSWPWNLPEARVSIRVLLLAGCLVT